MKHVKSNETYTLQDTNMDISFNMVVDEINVTKNILLVDHD